MAPALMAMIKSPSVIPSRAAGHRATVARRVSVKPFASTKAEATLVATSKDEFRCKVTEEGNLVCERLEPGNYKIQGVAVTDGPAKEGTVSYCYVLDDGKFTVSYSYVLDDGKSSCTDFHPVSKDFKLQGSVVCESIPSGEYAIKKATDEDLSDMVAHASKLAGIKVVSFD